MSAGVKINEPLCHLYDKNGVEVATKSTSIQKGMQKASFLTPDVYILNCPDMEITVTINPVVVHTNEATLSWTAPTGNTDNTPLIDLAGYKVYYGTGENDLSIVVDAAETQLKIKNLTPNITYYFAVTAVNDLDVESELSTITSKTIGE